MKSVAVIVGAGAAVGLYLMMRNSDGQGGGTTAGDDGANVFTDSVDTMTSVVSNWPLGSSPYRDTISNAASQYGVPVEILSWLFWKESRYSPDVIDGTRRSQRGALGIAQFMPATAIDELGSVDAALDPDQAIPGAARYLAKLYKSTGSWAGALAAYNWGIGNVLHRGLDAAPPETTDYYTTILARANSTGSAYA